MLGALRASGAADRPAAAPLEFQDVTPGTPDQRWSGQIRGLLACLEAARARRKAYMCERLEHGFFYIGSYAINSSWLRWRVMLRCVGYRTRDHWGVRPSITRRPNWQRVCVQLV